MKHEEANLLGPIRKEVYSLQAALTPEEANALRARFGIDDANRVLDDEEGTLRAWARELAMLKRRKV